MASVQLDKSDIEKSLKKKGFIEYDTDHKYLVYKSTDGILTTIKTKLSHGALPKSIGDTLIILMAKQCKLKKNEFIDLIKCPIDRTKYEHILKVKNLL